MKHYVWLGFNPKLPESDSNRKTAFHIPIFNESDLKKAYEIDKKLFKEVKNKATYSIYVVHSSDETWKSLIKENKYFGSISKPASNINEFIENLNNVTINSADVAKIILGFEKNVQV